MEGMQDMPQVLARICIYMHNQMDSMHTLPFSAAKR